MIRNLEQNSISNQLTGIVRLFSGNDNWENKSLKFFNFLFNDFSFDTVIFVPSVGIKSNFSALKMQDGDDIEPLNLVETWNELLFKDNEVQNSNEILHEGHSLEIVNELLNTVVKSLYRCKLVYGDKFLGYIIGFDFSVARIWNETDRQDLEMICQLFSQALYSEWLRKENSTKEKFLQKAIESANDGEWSMNLIDNKMHFSKQYQRMLGFEPGELASEFSALKERIHPEDLETVLQVLDPYYKIGLGKYECEYRLRNKAGKYIWVLTRANVLYSENGLPVEFKAVNIDITSRIEYKRELEKSELKYQNLISSIHETLFEVNHKGNLIFVNEAWERLFGFKINQTYGTSFIDYFHPDDQEYVKLLLQKPTNDATEDNLSFETRMVKNGSTACWVEVHAARKFNDEFKLIGFKGFIIDITEKKKIQVEKENGERKFSRILRNVSDIIVEVDGEGKYTFVNHAVRNVLLLTIL